MWGTWSPGRGGVEAVAEVTQMVGELDSVVKLGGTQGEGKVQVACLEGG